MLQRLIKTLALLLLIAGAAYAFLKYQSAQVQLHPEHFDGFLQREAVRPDYVPLSREPCRDNNPMRNAFFGALHIHTALSGDASAWGVTARPEDAYTLASGGEIAVGLRGDAPGDAPLIRLEQPLDFAAVTDHAEYLGETSMCLTEGSPAHGSFLCKLYRREIYVPVSETLRPMVSLASFSLFRSRSQRVCGEDGFACLEAASLVWDEHQRAAEEAYDRSADCSFTSFVGYEYSLAIEASNLHRNVIFANGIVPPSPLSSREAKAPELLWEWLQETCKSGQTGCDVMTIPHNSNWSSGRMFYPYSLTNSSDEEKRRLAALRRDMEPLVEVMQVKGDSECRNGLGGVLGEPDELCDFEKLRLPEEVAEDCKDGFGSKGMLLTGCLSRWSFVRYGLIEGLREEQRLGANSLKLGIIAATDSHIAAGGAVAEDRYPGSTGLDRTVRGQLRDPLEIPGVAKADPTRFNPGGIAGVWAEENTRESLFAAMQRRETFGTSGPRILPRFFGGWDYDQSLCDSPDMLSKAYSGGVPMGGDLPQMPEEGALPVFLLSASMDTVSGATPLQKIQLIKGWMDASGQMHQHVIDVVGHDQAPSALDTESCQPAAGHAALCAVWRDEAFEPGQSAVYYARVVENPSCRWTTRNCNSLTEGDKPAVCSSDTLPRVIQERAWTSPIWYSRAN